MNILSSNLVSEQKKKFQSSNKNSKTDISKLPLKSECENKASPADISSKNISLTFGEEGEVDKAAVKQLRATTCQERQIYEDNDYTEDTTCSCLSKKNDCTEELFLMLQIILSFIENIWLRS